MASHLGARDRCVAADGGSVYSGRVAWLKEPVRDGKPIHDANNADAGLRERPIMGLEIVSAFKPAAAGSFLFCPGVAAGTSLTCILCLSSTICLAPSAAAAVLSVAMVVSGTSLSTPERRLAFISGPAWI